MPAHSDGAAQIGAGVGKPSQVQPPRTDFKDVAARPLTPKLLARHRRLGTPETVTPTDCHKVLEANLTTTLCTKYCIPRPATSKREVQRHRAGFPYASGGLAVAPALHSDLEVRL
jgi:hypothetical protein